VQQLVPQFASTRAILNLEAAVAKNFSTSTATLHSVAGCWFHNTHRKLSSARIRSVWKKRTEVMRTSRTSLTVWCVYRCCRILPFSRRSYGFPTAACLQQQQRERGRGQSGANTSSDDVSGVGICEAYAMGTWACQTWLRKAQMTKNIITGW